MLPKFINPKVDGIHPLRHTLSNADLKRIRRAIKHELVDDCTLEELDAVRDIMFDHQCAILQTHVSEAVLQ